MEAQFAVGALKGERMRYRHLLAVVIPLIHPPEVGRLEVELQLIHHSRNQRQLFRRSDGPADAYRVIFRGLSPGGDVFERFCEVEFFERIVDHALETWP